MHLEMHCVDIQDIRPAVHSRAEAGVLYLDLDELRRVILADNRIAAVDLEIVRPGDRVRIVNVMDIVQPRCKVDRLDADFPGFVGKLQTAGCGLTRSLRGTAVVVSNPCTKRKYSALLDMSGMGAELSRYGDMVNVVIAPTIADGIDERDFEDAVKIAGFKTAVYMARAADKYPPDAVEVYDLDTVIQAGIQQAASLPRVAYYYQLYSPQHDHHGISDPCFYGMQVRELVPTIIHPNEVLDGGVVGHHTIRSLDTFSIQNHGVVKELYRRHGKELIFAGVVIGVANMDPIARKRNAVMAASLVKNTLGADGVVITKIHGGMPHVDLAMVADECEKLGVKTAVFIQPLIGVGTLADALLFNSASLDLIITVGATLERLNLPLAADHIIGGTAQTKVFLADPGDQRAGDPVIDQEEMLIAGIHDHTGSARIVVREF